MKKIISLLLATILLLSSLFALASCGGTEKESRINLTLSNYEVYLNVSAKLYGKNPHWNSLAGEYFYDYVTTSVEISPTTPLLKFYDCRISVRIVGSYYSGNSDMKNVNETLEVSLSLAGNGSNYKDQRITFSNANNITGRGYEVVSVSGYVIVD